MTHDELSEKCKNLGQQLRKEWPEAKDELERVISVKKNVVKEVTQIGFNELFKGIDDLIQQSEVPIDHDICLVDCSFLMFTESLSLPNLDYGITFQNCIFKIFRWAISF